MIRSRVLSVLRPPRDCVYGTRHSVHLDCVVTKRKSAARTHVHDVRLPWNSKNRNSVHGYIQNMVVHILPFPIEKD